MKAARWRLLLLTAVALLSLSIAGLSQIHIDLSLDDVDFTVFSRDGGDDLGSPNTMILGDFNDDRILDVLLGAPGGDGPDDHRPNAGEAYIIFGKPGAFPPSLNTDGIPGPDVVIYGRDPGDRLGSGVAAGDVNGDGVPDIILGAPGGGGPTNGTDSVGEVVVIFGGVSLPNRIDLRNEKQDLIIFNRKQRSAFGEAITAADINGDGIADIAVSDSTSNGRAAGNAGAVYLIYGRIDLPPRIDIGNSAPGLGENVGIFGADRGDRIGISLSKGDVNDDGMEDLIIGAPFAAGPGNNRPNGGEAYVVFGSFTLPGIIDFAATSADVTVMGADAQDQLGTSVDIGDVNGDGIQDLLIGAPMASGLDNLRGFAGEAYVIYGATLLPSIIDLREVEPGSRIIGSERLENLGSSVHAADLNDDGRNDLILGAKGGRGPEGGRSGAGKVYAIGSPGDLEPIIDLLEGGYDIVLYGANTGDNLGSALAGGDISAEGGFLLMGANGVDSPADGPDAGAVYALFAAEIIDGGSNGCENGVEKGDVDDDCAVTIIDARLVCESILGLRELTSKQVELADVAPPIGELTLLDAIWIAEAAVGLRNLDLDEPEEEEGSGQGVRASEFRVQRWTAHLRANQSIEFAAVGARVNSIQVEFFGLNGTSMYSSPWTAGQRLLWAGRYQDGQALANGVYLYVIRARSEDGRVINSDIRKLVIMR